MKKDELGTMLDNAETLINAVDNLEITLYVLGALEGTLSNLLENNRIDFPPGYEDAPCLHGLCERAQAIIEVIRSGASAKGL